MSTEAMNTYRLSAPIARGEERIETVTLSRPNAGALRGLKTIDLIQGDVSALIKLLEKHGLDVIPLKLRHSKLMGGGFHCVTLDTRRKGHLERYFD